MLKVTLNTKQKVRVTMNPMTDQEQPATITGTPSWTAQGAFGPNLSLPVVEPDGLAAEITSAKNPGVTNILVEAKFQQGPNVRDTIEVTVVQATNRLGLVAGTPEAQ